MGGRGSGSWYRWSKKSDTSSYWRLNISKLAEWGLLKDGLIRSGTMNWSRNGEVRSEINYRINMPEHYLNVSYINRNSQERFDYNIRLVHTKPYYGGKRWWFICPLVGCGRRVSLLYLGKHFGCRHCYNLAYECQNKSLAFRLQRKAQKIHESLGGNGCIDDYVPKPKRMRWKTYNQKMARLERFSYGSLIAISRQLGIKPEDLEF
jgi:hypothetical protein